MLVAKSAARRAKGSEAVKKKVKYGEDLILQGALLGRV